MEKFTLTSQKRVHRTGQRAEKKTGGGEAPRVPVTAMAKIIDPFKETPSFAGLEGFESKGDDYYSLVFKT